MRKALRYIGLTIGIGIIAYTFYCMIVDCYNGGTPPKPATVFQFDIIDTTINSQ